MATSSLCSMLTALSIVSNTNNFNNGTKISFKSSPAFGLKRHFISPTTRLSFHYRRFLPAIAMAIVSSEEEPEPEATPEAEAEAVAEPEVQAPVRTPYFDEKPPETEEEIAAAYEALYGPAYSGISVLGNDVDAVDKKIVKGFGLTKKVEKIKDGFEERVVQVRRVTKVVKGGKQMSFRAIVVVGDKKGKVGVGVGKAKEVIAAVQKSAVDARRHVVNVPMTKYLTFPHRADGHYGAAKVMLRPASPGTGVIAGGAVKVVLEMAGVESALGKQLGSENPLNNARAVIDAVSRMRQFSEVAELRGIPMEELWQ
eukprot:Gb_10529 [translate_table: standard]